MLVGTNSSTAVPRTVFFFRLRCGNYGAKAVRQLKVFWGSQIGSWALQPLPTGNVRLGVKLLIRLRTQ